MTPRPFSCLPVLAAGFCLALSASAAETRSTSALSTARVDLPGAATGPAATSNGIAVIVNGRPILKSEVEEQMQGLVFEAVRRFPDPVERAAEIKKIREKVLDTLIDQELILKEFEPYAVGLNSKVEAHADEMIRKQFIRGYYKGDSRKFHQDVEASGIGYKKFYEKQKRSVIVEWMRAQFAKPESDYVTEDEKAAFLKKNSDMFRVGGKIKLWSITIPAQADAKTPAQQSALAKEVRASLVNGADFASQARIHSADSKRENGGSWDWVEQKDLNNTFWPVVSQLPSGKISEVIPLEGSYYIFWVEARQPGKMKPAEEVDKVVERRILFDKRQKATDIWVQKLRKKATIIFPK